MLTHKSTSSFSHECILLPLYLYNIHQDTKSVRLIAVCNWRTCTLISRRIWNYSTSALYHTNFLYACFYYNHSRNCWHEYNNHITPPMQYKDTFLAYKCMNNLAPLYLCTKYTKRSQIHNRPTKRHNNDVNIPKYRTSTGQRTFAYIASKV